MSDIPDDRETQKLATAADHVVNMLESDGWRIVKDKLDAKILDLQNINNLDFTTTDSVLFDLKARKMASDILFAWLKEDVYGFVEQQNANLTKLDADMPSFIERQ